MSSVNRDYVPTVVELNDAVAAILEASTGIVNAKDVTAKLKKEQPTWKLPERRVVKFVKRQKAGNPISSADEEASVGSGFSLRSLISSRSIKSTPSSEAPVKEEEEEVAAAEAVSSVSKEEVVTVATSEEPEDVVTAEKEAPIAVVDTKAYADDNDGKKECGCWCR